VRSAGEGHALSPGEPSLALAKLAMDFFFFLLTNSGRSYSSAEVSSRFLSDLIAYLTHTWISGIPGTLTQQFGAQLVKL
jgi:hypothetical protein